MQANAQKLVSADLATFVTNIGLDQDIADNILAEGLDGSFIVMNLNDNELLSELGMTTAVQQLKFQCLLQRHLLQKASAFPPDKVAEFFATKASLKPSIEV